MIDAHKSDLTEPPAAGHLRQSPGRALKTACTILCFFLGFSNSGSAQNLDGAPSNLLRRPGWNFGLLLSGGSTVVESSAPRFPTAGHSISNLALMLHAGRVLTHQHGPSWMRGTFEWDVSVIPMDYFWVLGGHYAGGFEALGPRWNFTSHRKLVPFMGIGGGMIFSPSNFPPGDTARFDFTVAVDAGTHVFLRPRRSVDVDLRAQHISNAYLGHLNPGVPLSMQVTVGYSSY